MSTLSELHERLASAAADFRVVVESADLDAPVPSCPGWTLADLAGHLGGIYRFATAGIVEKAPVGEAAGPVDEVREALLEWFDSGYDGLQRALKEHPWDEECWNFGPKPRTVGFWVRRQAHETVLHVWDAQMAAHRKAAAIDAATAADGIDEVLTMFLPRQLRLERIAPIPDRVELVASDCPDGRSRFVVGGEPDTAISASVTASAEDLLLLLYHRTELDSAAFSVAGDAAAAQRTLATQFTP